MKSWSKRPFDVDTPGDVSEAKQLSQQLQEILVVENPADVNVPCQVFGKSASMEEDQGGTSTITL